MSPISRCAATPAPAAGGDTAPGARFESGSIDTVLFDASVRFTGCRHGDMADLTGVDRVVAARRRAVLDRPWTVLHQVHGSEVVVVDRAGGEAGRAGDACVTGVGGVALAVLTADCAPVAFASAEGIIGVAHAGWRGLVAGVVEETVATMRALGAGTVHAALGPCIRAECYAFGPDDLDRAAASLGDAVRATTRAGAPALDLAAGVAEALRRVGAELVFDAGMCTSCSAGHWSWRARSDTARQATVVWLP